MENLINYWSSSACLYSVLISSCPLAPSGVSVGCLQVWPVDTHESLPHNVAFQRICRRLQWHFFPLDIRKKTRRQRIRGSRPCTKITWKPETKSDHQQTVWLTLDAFVSLTGAVQTEALRGIGIYRWQETKRGDKSDPLVSWSQTEVDVKRCWKLFFKSYFREHCKLWRKNTIFFLNCCSSETAEWAKHVWSSDLPRTISTPHTSPPSVRFLPPSRPACVHPNRTLLNVDVSSSSWLMLNTFHVFMSPLARVVLSVFHALFSFPFPCLFLHPLPRPHSSHSAHRRSTHPHSYLFTISAFPEEKLTSLACTFIPLQTLSSVCQLKNRQ